MWRKVLFSVILCVRILDIVQEASSEETEICSDNSKGHRFCQSNNADCKESSGDPRGFECVCPEGRVMDADKFCIDKSEQTAVTTTAAARTTFAESTSTTLSSLSSSASPTPSAENTPSETSEASFQRNFTFSTFQPTQVSLSSSVSSTTLNKSHLGSTTSAPDSGMLDWPMSAKVTAASLLGIIVVVSAIAVYLFYRNLKIRKCQQLVKNQVVYKKENEDSRTDSMATLVVDGFI